MYYDIVSLVYVCRNVYLLRVERRSDEFGVGSSVECFTRDHNAVVCVSQILYGTGDWYGPPIEVSQYLRDRLFRRRFSYARIRSPIHEVRFD